jgi:hypothetical protein
MSAETMGIVPVAAKIENLDDVSDLQDGKLSDDQIRRVEVNEALSTRAPPDCSCPAV